MVEWLSITVQCLTSSTVSLFQISDSPSPSQSSKSKYLLQSSKIVFSQSHWSFFLHAGSTSFWILVAVCTHACHFREYSAKWHCCLQLSIYFESHGSWKVVDGWRDSSSAESDHHSRPTHSIRYCSSLRGKLWGTLPSTIKKAFFI